MNYRHAFHAGNFADVFKHALLVALLDALTAKDKPLCYFDTHAGRGCYALDAAGANATGEWRNGIGRLWDRADVAPPLRRYLELVGQANSTGKLASYPGSPLLAAMALRADDRLVLCESERDVADALRVAVRNDSRAHVHQRDGYEALHALLPPREHRGLVLIDPPFEVQDDDFGAIETALDRAEARWPRGVYAAWYPIKSRRTLAPFHRHFAAGPLERVLACELLVQPDNSPLRFNGCGMLIVNPPWRVEGTLQALLPALRDALAQSAGADQALRWLRHD